MAQIPKIFPHKFSTETHKIGVTDGQTGHSASSELTS